MSQRVWSVVVAAWLGACALPEYVTLDGSSSTAAAGAQGGGTAGRGAATGGDAAGGDGGAGAVAAGGAGPGGASPCPAVDGAEVVACNRARPVAVAVDNTNVYWADEGDGQVMAAPKAGGPAVVIASGQGQPCGVAARGGFLYWRTREGALRRKQIPAGAQEDLALGQGDACAVDADATAVFWMAEEGSAYAVMMAAPPGSSPKKIASALSAGDLDAQGAGEVGWTDPAAGKAYTSPKIMGDDKTQIATGAVREIAFHGPDYFISIVVGGSIVSAKTGNAELGFASGLDGPTGIAVWNNEVLWIEEGADRVARKDVGSPVTDAPLVLLGGVPVCGAIAADAVHVYFGTCDDGRVIRVPHAEAIVIRH